jgi:predicted PurR-regulated permease PerM
LFYVFLFYVIIQTIEGMFITPMVHRKAIVVPPVLILSVQVILFQLIGLIGVILAMPLMACAVVLTQMIYIEGILKEPKARKTDTSRKDTETDAVLPG